MPRTLWKRRAVERDVSRFAGWETIIELAGKLRDPYQAIYATAFLTGGRISEVLSLKRENFTIDAEFVNVRDMLLLKRYKKTGARIEAPVDQPPKTTLGRLYIQDPTTGKWTRRRYYTEKILGTRIDFGIRRDEPLCSLLCAHLDKIETGSLFPDISRWMVHTRLKEIGIYPHWLRAQRASCLISFWRFTMEEMMEWMGWKELSTAQRYARMGPKLYEKFAGVRIPQGIKKLEALQIPINREIKRESGQGNI